jgi:hypothetical protein
VFPVHLPLMVVAVGVTVETVVEVVVTASQQSSVVVPSTPAPLFWVLVSVVPSPPLQSTSPVPPVFPVHLPLTAVHPAYGVSTPLQVATVHPAYGWSAAPLQAGTAHPSYGVSTAVQAGTVQPTYGVSTAVHTSFVQPVYGVFTAVQAWTVHPSYGVSTPLQTLLQPTYGTSVSVQAAFSQPAGSSSSAVVQSPTSAKDPRIMAKRHRESAIVRMVELGSINVLLFV